MSILDIKLADLQATVASSLQSKLKTDPATLKYHLLGVLGDVMAAGFYSGTGQVKYAIRQTNILTADEEYLLKLLEIEGIFRNPATKATGYVIFTGSNNISIPIGLKITTGSNLTYTTQESKKIQNGKAVVLVVCDVAGLVGNLHASTKLYIQNPISQINQEVFVDAEGINGGNEVEGIEELRARGLASKRQGNMYGKKGDYIIWVKQQSVVDKAWEKPHSGTKCVLLILCLAKNNRRLSVSEIASLTEHMNNVVPTDVLFEVASPVLIPVDFKLQISPNTISVQQAILSNLSDFFEKLEPNAQVSNFELQTLIARTDGLTSVNLLEPQGIYMAENEYPILGEIIYV